MALKVLDRLRNPLQEYLRILGDPISAVFGAMSEIWSDAKALSLIRGDDNVDGQLMLQQGALWISALAGDVRFTENTGWVPEIIQTLSAPHALDTQALEPKGTRNSQGTPAPQPVMQDGSTPGDKIDRAISTVITARKGFVSGVLIPVLLMLAVTAATFFDAYSKQGDKDTGLALAYCVWYSWILTLGVAGNCFASSLNTDVAERALDAVFDFGGKTMSTSLGDRYVNAYMWKAWVGSFDSGLSADGWDFQAARSRLASDWRFWLRLCGGQLLGFCCVAFSSACAVAIAWTTPTVGLGCRSFNFILFAIFSFITGYLNVLCSWLSILSEARASSSSRQRRAKILLRVVLGLYWVFVLANSLVVILGTLFHMVGVFRTCWCERLTWSDTTLIELNSKTAQAVDNAQSYWLSTAYVAFGLRQFFQVTQMAKSTIKVAAVHFDNDHSDAFSQAIRCILKTSLSEVTMAQLLDGLPQADVAWEARGNLLIRANPLADHAQLCGGVLEKTRSWRDDFDPDTLQFEPQLLQAYSDAEMGSKEFNLRLIEMVAVSVHQIAVALFDLAPKAHTLEHIRHVTDWQKPPGWNECYGRKTWEEPLFPPPPTHVFHCAYLDYDIYPDGLADVAGYWAEDRIVGGVILFDRGQSGKECKEIFLHPGRQKETFRRTPLERFPLPLTATDENLHRLDPWDAIALHHVFRDPWERRIPVRKPPERDVRSVGDYPELQILFQKMDKTIQQVESHSESDITNNHEPHVVGSHGEETSSPDKPDRLWIYRHGGHMGDPLGTRRLPYLGPPEGDQAKIAPEDGDSDDEEYSNCSFGQGFSTPSLFAQYSESLEATQEALSKKVTVPPSDDKLRFGTTKEHSTISSASDKSVRDTKSDVKVPESGTDGEGAEDLSRKRMDTRESVLANSRKGVRGSERQKMS
ncbi:hypothetical protein B0I35DRAFT_480606 [Stachybotrys elegans]|uniref:Uncharacterized protein n=1 Tax=Stachybotrys elegans TaxID=80388 RepID=A0A8K0SSK2_9HYPO|nr:hypothetical protein B0I35DRAFT_480606 [Stachybotrys elegans]